MGTFKVNFENKRGIATVRSKFNSPVQVKRSTGIAFENKAELKQIEARLLDTYNALKALSFQDRVNKYGTPLINLETIWEKYESDRGEKTGVSNAGVSEEILLEISKFPQTQKKLSDHYVNGTAQMVIMHLSYFANSQGYRKLKFSDITRPFLTAYENYLRYEETQFVYKNKLFKKKKLKSATVKKHFGVISRACKYANGEVETNNAIHAYEIQNLEVGKKTKSLEYRELMNLFDYANENQLHDTVYIWLFMAFSGLRIGTVEKLFNNQLFDGFINWANPKDNFNLVHTTIHKNNAAILQRYVSKDAGLIFPDFSRTTMRVHVNRVLEKIGIDKVVGIHSARHTYNNLLKKLPIRDFDINQEMGHKHTDTNSKHYTEDELEQRKANIVGIFEDLDKHIKKPLQLSKKYNDIFSN